MLRRIQLASRANKMAVKNVAFFSVPATSALGSASASPAAATPDSTVRPVRLAAIPPQGASALATPRRTFLDGVFGAKQQKVAVDSATFDKETTHYRGTLFGMPADDVIFYAKVLAGAVVVVAVFYIFFKGYALLTRFSMQTVARLGFMSGFVCCMIIYTTAVQLVRRAHINANAVYNQSIALVMHNEKVQQVLGAHPRTGEFKTYSASGGFKLPLLRRIRSGSYELSDLLGLKPRRLQMLFVLKNPGTDSQGVVAADVRRETTGFMSSTNVYRSLSITLSDKVSKKEPETIILIGKPEDVIYTRLLRVGQDGAQVNFSIPCEGPRRAGST